jgi:hypothetical protein
MSNDGPADENLVTCPDCGYTAPRLGLISLHEPDCPNVCDDDTDGDWDDDEPDGPFNEGPIS